MNTNLMIELFGGREELAAFLGITRTSIYGWKGDSLPELYERRIKMDYPWLAKAVELLTAERALRAGAPVSVE